MPTLFELSNGVTIAN